MLRRRLISTETIVGQSHPHRAASNAQPNGSSCSTRKRGAIKAISQNSLTSSLRRRCRAPTRRCDKPKIAPPIAGNFGRSATSNGARATLGACARPLGLRRRQSTAFSLVTRVPSRFRSAPNPETRSPLEPHRFMATIDPTRPVSTLRIGHLTFALSRARRPHATTFRTCRQANSVRNESGMPIPTMSVTSCGSRS
jgi:hypothetical protein